MAKSNHDAKSDKEAVDYSKGKPRKGKGGKRKGEFSVSEKDRRTVRAPKYNDVHWYVPSEQLLIDACSLSYNNPLGNTLRVTDFSDFSVGGTYAYTNNLDTPIPGIMTIHSAPGVGFSNSNNSPISLAAKSLYARIRKDNSGAKNYEPADLIKYIMALDSAICVFGFFSRAYGCLRLYSAYNRYWPRAVVTACNLDFNDLLAHMADFRYYLNSYAIKIDSLFMPTVMNIVPRHFFMYSGLWKDTDVRKSQLYVHVPDWVYMYNEQVTPSRLDPLEICDRANVTTPMTFANIVSYLDTISNALLVSEDIGIISGDLMKAFGEGNAFKLNEIPIDFEVEPVYEERVLAQIQSTKFMGRLDMQDIRITESTAADDTLGCILCTPYNNDPQALPNVAHPVNFYRDVVTPEDTMEATRLMAFGYRNMTQDSGGNNIIQNTFYTVGSEFPLYFELWYNDAATGAPTVLTISSRTEWTNYISLTGAAEIDQLYSAISSFDHMPYVDRATWNASTGTTTFSQPWGVFDWANYTIVNGAMVSKMHETAFLALFGIDTLAKGF